jgi:hypothetical protein
METSPPVVLLTLALESLLEQPTRPVSLVCEPYARRSQLIKKPINQEEPS